MPPSGRRRHPDFSVCPWAVARPLPYLKETDNAYAHRHHSQLLRQARLGDAPGALGLMAPDIEWITMWHYRVDGRGPERVAEGLFKPLMAEWSSFATGKKAAARYAHVWTVKDSKITRFRQYIDTLAIAEARRS
jgi:uncharacterized protein